MRAEEPDPTDDRTILTGADPEFLSDLSEYLDVLASPVRLRILSFVGIRSRTVRQISHEISTSYENTKKHLSKLLSLGLIRKEIGVSDDAINSGQPVFYYSLVPGGLDHAVKSLSVFSSVTDLERSGISEQLKTARDGLLGIMPSPVPSLVIVSGPEQGSLIPLTEDRYRIGRVDEGWTNPSHDPVILISDEYRSVSRISRPHAWITRRAGRWLLADGISKGGTKVNDLRVTENPEILKDGDTISLSTGPLGIILQFQSGSSVQGRDDS